LLARLIDMPDLPEVVRELPPPAFTALVRRVGVEDAGELLSLATTEQLVAAFDEDLFANERPGERETFDPERFVTWLEVLLEAGDGVAAARFVELSEDFVVRALTSVVLVLDDDALRTRMGEGDDDAVAADKALEASLSEELDGYLLVARRSDGWDAVLALVLALDRDHRAFLERVLDHAARLSSHLTEELDELVTALSDVESLAEHVEAEREDRRARQGYVEPRAARSFLDLAQRPFTGTDPSARDPVTRAYFRELSRETKPARAPVSPKLAALVAELAGPEATVPLLLPAGARARKAGEVPKLTGAMQRLRELDRARFEERLEELAYLTNVLVAGAPSSEGRYRPADAAASVLATVTRGAELVLEERGGRETLDALAEVLRTIPADLLFRRAGGARRAQGKR
jgi:hypothetical protein